MVESFSTFVLVLLGMAAFLNLKEGTLGTWARAKFFNAAAPNPKRGKKRPRGGAATTPTIDTSGALQFPGGLRYPLPGAPSCGDGWHAPRPGRLHMGADLRAGKGTPIGAAAPGKVVAAGAAGGYGLKVDVDHGSGSMTRYAHMDRILVHVGQTVDAGQQLGTVGSTGNSTGPHLHFEYHRDGKAVDPAPAIGATCERVGSRVMDRAFASGLLLLVIGLWLLLQTLVGDLPRRVLSHAGAVDPGGAESSVVGSLLSPVNALARAVS